MVQKPVSGTTFSIGSKPSLCDAASPEGATNSRPELDPADQRAKCLQVAKLSSNRLPHGRNQPLFKREWPTPDWHTGPFEQRARCPLLQWSHPLDSQTPTHRCSKNCYPRGNDPLLTSTLAWISNGSSTHPQSGATPR